MIKADDILDFSTGPEVFVSRLRQHLTVRKLLHTDWLFLILLTGSTAGHFAIGEFGSHQADVLLTNLQEGESSIAVQLLASSTPPVQPDIVEHDTLENDSLIDRSHPEVLTQLDSQEPPNIESDLIRQPSTDQQVNPEDEIECVPTANRGDLLEMETAAEANSVDDSQRSDFSIPEPVVSSLPPVRSDSIQASEPKPMNTVQRTDVIRKDPPLNEVAQLDSLPVIRTASVMEWEVETTTADAPPRKGNADADVVVEAMNGANTTPTLDPSHPQNRPPVFPQNLVSRGVSGTVKLEVVVLPTGKVESTKVVVSTGSQQLDELAREAVAKWQFNPGLTNGQAATKRVIVPITYRIERRRAGLLQR